MISTALRIEGVHIPIGAHVLHGDLIVPTDTQGIVLFAHGSGSSRHSPRNRFVAATLNERRLATLLIDLLSEDEELVDARTAHLRFDIEMLADRLVAIGEWIVGQRELASTPVGLFGASTGGGAALVAAAKRAALFQAVVSRGGRPDLAGDALAHVVAPTLLIVGERDVPVIRMNQDAMAQMHGEVRLEIVPRATHLFEEPGALERVAALAGEWLEDKLSAARTS